MKLINFFCGLLIVEYKGIYACVDKYTDKIKCKGTRESCEEYFNTYISNVCDEGIY